VQRLKAFTQCCDRKGLAYEIVELDSFTIDAGREGVRQMIERDIRCSAIVAGNDLIAVGAIQKLQELSVRVPQDISIVGFNGMPFSDMFNPPLTTVAIPHKNLGEQAARLLLEEVGHPGGPKQKVLLTPTLLVRGSTTNAPKKILKVGTLANGGA
jgi:LacI family transcriptional regulator